MDYKSAYFMLFNKITDVISALETLQLDAEELAIGDCEPTLIRILSADPPEHGGDK